MIISSNVQIPDDEVELTAIRAQGAGGQNVNKVSSAIHCRFDIRQSSLPDYYKQQLLNLSDRRISRDGIIIIKAQRFRTQEKNRADALARLTELIQDAGQRRRKRVATRPGKGVLQRRKTQKSQHSQKKNLRAKPGMDS